jgi:hypothetical protein
MKKPLFLFAAAAVALALVGCESTVSTAKLLKVTVGYEDLVEGGTRHLSRGVWVLVGSEQNNPLFTQDSADGKAMGIEPLAETGMHSELAKYLSDSGMVSGIFMGANTGKTGMTSFSLIATPGSKLYFATMVAPSNDWIAAPAASGIALFQDDGAVNTASPTIYVWDAGTEMEDPATAGGMDGNNDDDPADPDATVRIVPEATAMFKVTVTVEEL